MNVLGPNAIFLMVPSYHVAFIILASSYVAEGHISPLIYQGLGATATFVPPCVYAPDCNLGMLCTILIKLMESWVEISGNALIPGKCQDL